MNVDYENRITAFIDILGFKEIIKQSETDKTKIEILNSTLLYLKTWEIPKQWNLNFVEIEESVQKKGVEKFNIENKTHTTTFSDSIVVSVKVENDNINEMLSTLVANLSLIGAELIQKGILFRGAITIGNLVHNDNGTVFGSALIEAYELESKCAKYPRIILSNKLINELKYPEPSEKDEYLYHQYFQRYSDGCVGFHQMIFFQVMKSWGVMNGRLKDSLDAVRKVIINGLDSSFESTDVFAKFKWLQKQYENLIILNNDFVTDNGAFREELKLPIVNLSEKSGFCIHYSENNKYH